MYVTVLCSAVTGGGSSQTSVLKDANRHCITDLPPPRRRRRHTHTHNSSLKEKVWPCPKKYSAVSVSDSVYSIISFTGHLTQFQIAPLYYFGH